MLSINFSDNIATISVDNDNKLSSKEFFASIYFSIITQIVKVVANYGVTEIRATIFLNIFGSTHSSDVACHITKQIINADVNFHDIYKRFIVKSALIEIRNINSIFSNRKFVAIS